MENKTARTPEEFEEILNAFPQKMRNAVYWMIANIDFVEALTEGEKMSEIEVEKFIQSAKEKEDDLALCLILYKQQKDKFAT